MKKRYRVVRRRDFQQALARPRLYAGRAVVAFARPGTGGRLRVGVAVSRRLATAVRRNRARRRVREAARLELLEADSERAGEGTTTDVVLIARPAALELPFARLREELACVRRQLGRP